MTWSNKVENQFVVAISGTREYKDFAEFERLMNSLEVVRKATVLVCGEYHLGIDAMVRPYCEKWRKSYIGVPVLDWQWREGKKAGPERNERMLFTTKPDHLVAFPDARSFGGGTRNTIKIAEDNDIPVTVIELEV